MASDDTSGTTEDAPLIDLNEASIKKLIAKAKRRGYLTYDELNEALPSGEMSSDQIEDIQSAINDMGINIVENDEADEDDGEPEIDAAAEDGSDGSEGERVITVDGRLAIGVVAATILQKTLAIIGNA